MANTLTKRLTAITTQSKQLRVIITGTAAFMLLAAVGLAAPKWLTYLLTMSAGYGLVSLGVVGLMRSGAVSFGQGMVFAAGGYAAAVLSAKAGITDALALTFAGGTAAVILCAPFALLLARYRGIFFATLTLALSMLAFGLLTKLEFLGGSDGFNIGRPTLLGQTLASETAGYILFLMTMGVTIVLSILARIYFNSTSGLIALAARDNEIRVEYLGGSVRNAMVLNYLFAAFCGGVGGALIVLSLGHVEPNFSYWTTSGEFVFVAVLAGTYSVAAVFIASTLLEVVRSFSSAYFPTTWQLVLGVFLLFVIRFLPNGIGSLWSNKGDRS